MTDKRNEVAEALRRVREEVRQRVLLGNESEPAPLPTRPVRPPTPLRGEEETAAPEPDPVPPGAEAVNEAWTVEPERPRGLAGLLFRLLDRVLRPRFAAQRAFNARQVQLDNEVLRYLGERTAATHRHYDRVLGLYGRHLGEIDERHMVLQEELVAHVQDLVRRIDLALSESDRGRLSLEFALEDLRARLASLEEALRKRG